MAGPQPGVTLTFQLSTAAPTQLSIGLQNRHGFIVSNNDTANNISVGLGTGNAATATPPMHIVLPGNIFAFGESGNASGSGPQSGANVPVTDVSAIAVSGSPNVAFTEW